MGLLGSVLGVALGGLSGGGALIGAKSARKGARRAAEAVQANADRSNALAGQIYQQDRSALGAYAQPGNPAGTQMNALLGLGGQQPMQSPGQTFGGANTTMTAMNPQQSAFDQFRNSTGYQFRLGEGMNALNSGYAGAGLIQSGAAMRGAQEYGQNFASNEFGNYMNMLDNQQRMGLAGTTAQAGLGQSYVGTVSNNNAMVGDAQANAALIRGQNNPFAAFAGGVSGALTSAFAGGGF